MNFKNMFCDVFILLDPLAYKYGTAGAQTNVSAPYDPYAQSAYGQTTNYMGSHG